MRLPLIIVLLSSIESDPAIAETIYINCAITSSINEREERPVPTSGEDVYVVDRKEDGRTTYTIPIPCDQDTVEARETDLSLDFACEFGGLGVHTTYSVSINRVSGEYTKIWKFEQTGSYLMSFGNCARSEQRF